MTKIPTLNEADYVFIDDVRYVIRLHQTNGYPYFQVVGPRKPGDQRSHLRAGETQAEYEARTTP